jgi:hypothetical protein
VHRGLAHDAPGPAGQQIVDQARMGGGGRAVGKDGAALPGGMAGNVDAVLDGNTPRTIAQREMCDQAGQGRVCGVSSSMPERV